MGFGNVVDKTVVSFDSDNTVFSNTAQPGLVSFFSIFRGQRLFKWI